MKLNTLFILMLNVIVIHTAIIKAENSDNLFSLSLEEFLNVDVVSVSKKNEKLYTAPASVYVITSEEIERYGFLHLQDALKIIPSVYLYNPHSWVWGGQRGLVSNFSQTLLLLNGREMNNLIAQEGFISRQFATHNIKRIEVMASPGSALYGANALAGVINIITKDADKNYDGTEFSFESGSNSSISGSLLFGKKIKDLSIKGSLRYFRSDEEDFTSFVNDTSLFSKGWSDNKYVANKEINYKNNSSAIPINLQIDFKDFYGGVNYYKNNQSHGQEKLRWDYSDGEDVRDFAVIYGGMASDLTDKIRLKMEYQHTRDYMYGRYHSGFWPVSRLESSDNIPIYEFAYPVISSSGDSLVSIDEVKEYYSTFADYLIDQGLLDSGNVNDEDIQKYFTHIYSNKNSDGSRRNKAEMLFSTQFNQQISLDVGYSYDITSYAGLVVTDAGTGLGATYDIPINKSVRKDHYDSFKHGLYSQLKASLLNHKLWFVLGGRFDYQNHYGGTFNPRVGVVFSPTKKDVIKFMYGEAFREPNVFELSSNEDVEPAKLRSLEAQYFRSFGDISRIGLTGYYNSVSNFLSSVGSLIGTGVGEVEKQRVAGLEFQSDIKWRSIMFFLNGAYIIDISQEIREDNSDKTIRKDVLGIPDKKLNTGLSYNPNKYITVSLIYSLIDKYKALSGNSSVSEPFWIDRGHDMKTTLRIGEISLGKINFDGLVTVNNLLNRELYHANIRRSGSHIFLQEGRNISLKLRLKL